MNMENEVKNGINLSYFRNKRGYTLRYVNGKFEVRQGATNKIDIKTFDSFDLAFDWLKNGTPIK